MIYKTSESLVKMAVFMKWVQIINIIVFIAISVSFSGSYDFNILWALIKIGVQGVINFKLLKFIEDEQEKGSPWLVFLMCLILGYTDPRSTFPSFFYFGILSIILVVSSIFLIIRFYQLKKALKSKAN